MIGIQPFLLKCNNESKCCAADTVNVLTFKMYMHIFNFVCIPHYCIYELYHSYHTILYSAYIHMCKCSTCECYELLYL